MSTPFLADGVYLSVQSPTITVAGGNPNLPAGLVGTGTWGKLNTPIPFSDTASLTDGIGSITTAANDLATNGTVYLQVSQAMGSRGNAFAVRVDDGTSTAATISLQDSAGTPGNLFVFTAACTGTRGNTGTAQITQGSNYSSTKPTYNLILTIANAAPEVFQNIVAYSSTNYSSTAFSANLLAAVNNGANLTRPKSAYWIASAASGQSTLTPGVAIYGVTGNTTSGIVTAGSTAGTDGSSGVTSTNLIGTDGNTRTGMYALRGLGLGQFSIAGLTDMTVASTLASFAASESTFCVGPSFASGTSTSSAITSKQTNNVTSIYQGIYKNWLYWFDPVAGYNRLVAPATAALGIIGATSPEKSPGNQPAIGLGSVFRGTELTSPISQTEQAQLTQAGIGYFGALPRSQSLIGLNNGQNASGIPGQDGVNYTRLTNYLSVIIPQILGPFVDQLQGTSPNDTTRRLVKAQIDATLTDMKRAGQIDSFLTTCDLTNNTPTSIAAGQLNIFIQVKYLGTARFINATLQGGVGVTISSNSGQVTQAA